MSAVGVLVVDDEPALLNVVARTLRSAGFDVTTCADGSEAATLLLSRTFDVVLSDIDMPWLSGIELLRLLRDSAIDVPVVLMTGSPTLETAVRAVDHGAFKYLTKPLSPDDLIEAVTRAARSRAASGAQRVPGVGGESTRASMLAGAVLAERYRLACPLGQGGMSQVWEAVHVGTRRPVALKVLHTALNARPEMRGRLLREARVAGSLGHPNVVDVLDVFELHDGTPVLVMELLRGRTLGQHLADAGPLDMTVAAGLLLPVVSAVGLAHSRGVVHRDLKPENVFLAQRGDGITAKVLDFGIAKLVDPEPQDGPALTAAGLTVGTPGYMAPEQAFGERDVDCRADVWSLGAILYEVLAGARPVEANSVGQVVKVLMVDGIVPLARRRPQLPPGVSALVDRMLIRERDERPRDLRELYSELSRYTRVSAPPFGLPPAAPPPPSSGVTLASAPFAYSRTERTDATFRRK